MGNKIYYADNLEVLKSILSASIDLIYIDPPFNTGKTQSLHDKSYSDDFANFEDFIWVYDYGARSKTRWSAKHDNILWYVKDANKYIFNYEEMERIPYMSPELVGKEKAEKGKTVTDTWWHTIVATNGKERLGYPTQKPLGIIRRIVKVSSLPDSTVMDFFAGSGTLGLLP